MKTPQYQSPLARGWCAGIAPDADPDLTLPTLSKAVSMKRRPNSIASTAARLGVTGRTVSRYRAAGVNTNSADALAEYLNSRRNASPKAMCALTAIIEAEILTR